MRGEVIKKEMAEGSTKFKFDKIIPCNIGNPQAVGQGNITFNR
jgi:aspartate/methionine/tyrosine aminotransferase